MKKWLLLSILFFVFCYPESGYGQWKFFEHRYKYDLSDVLDASEFKERENYWEGYRDGKLAGYVFLSKKLTERLVGYSGKHMETLIGMDTKGELTGVKLIFHSEPIVLIGLKNENYLDFMKQYPGRDIRVNLSIGKEISLDAITGATVTGVVQNAIILQSARKVASETGILEFAEKKEKHRIRKKYSQMTWKELLESGAVKNIVVRDRDVGQQGDDVYLDLYIGLVTPPSIGRNVLGDKFYADVMASLKKDESALFIFSRGEGSFKGAGFARGGIFDRFNISQEDRVYVVRDIDYRALTEINAEHAPDVKEGGVFIISKHDFEQSLPFKFNLVLPYRVGGKKEFNSFSVDYAVPDRFLE